MTIIALPTAPPSRKEPSTFSQRMDATLGAFPTLISEINTDTAAFNTDSANQLSTLAAGIAQWSAVESYAVGRLVWSPITFLTYRRIVAGTTATDPSADTTNWLFAGSVELDTAPKLGGDLDLNSHRVVDSSGSFGNDNDVLRTTGAINKWDSEGLTLLSVLTLSGASSVIISFPAGYSNFVIKSALTPDAYAGYGLNIRINSQTSSYRGFQLVNGGLLNFDAHTALDTSIIPFDNTATTITTNLKTVAFDITCPFSGSSGMFGHGYGYHHAAGVDQPTTISSLQLYLPIGYLSGTVRVYGYKDNL